MSAPAPIGNNGPILPSNPVTSTNQAGIIKATSEGMKTVAESVIPFIELQATAASIGSMATGRPPCGNPTVHGNIPILGLPDSAPSLAGRVTAG